MKRIIAELNKDNRKIATKMDNALSSSAGTTKSVTILMSKVEILNTENSYLKSENRDLKQLLLQSEYHQCHGNLFFDGYGEERNETDRKFYFEIKRQCLICMKTLSKMVAKQ